MSASVLVTACAGTPSQRFVDQAPSKFLIAGSVPIPPPLGLTDFCVRNASVCAQSSGGSREAGSVSEMDNSQPQAARWMTAASSNAGAQPLDQMALFRALVLAIADADAARGAEPQRVALTSKLWKTLRSVNWTINMSIRAADDASVYGAQEWWALPLSGSEKRSRRAPQGDCEDFALEKRAALLGLGVPAEALSLAVVSSPQVGVHAVLVVRTDRGDFLLDNLAADPMPAWESTYTFVSMQRGPSLSSWSVAHFVDSADPARADVAERHHATLDAPKPAPTLPAPMVVSIAHAEHRRDEDAQIDAAAVVIDRAAADTPQSAPTTADRAQPLTPDPWRWVDNSRWGKALPGHVPPA
jgi:predicted transglutaminase-like cysteine proteinase